MADRTFHPELTGSDRLHILCALVDGRCSADLYLECTDLKGLANALRRDFLVRDPNDWDRA